MQTTINKPKVRWTKPELDYVCRGVIAIVSADKAVRLLTAIHRTEEQLPLDRRRLRPALSQYGVNAKKAFQEAYQVALRTPASRPPAEPKPEEAPTATSEGQGTCADVEDIGGPPDHPPDEDLVRSFDSIPTNLLLAEILMRIGENLTNRLDRLEAALIARLVPAPAVPHRNGERHSSPNGPRPEPSQSASEPKCKVIAVVGLFKDQFEHVRAKVSDLPFRLHWLDKESAKPFIPGADYVIVQRHSSHRWWAAAQRAVPSDHLAFVDGGVTQVVQKVMDFHARSCAQAAMAHVR